MTGNIEKCLNELRSWYEIVFDPLPAEMAFLDESENSKVYFWIGGLPGSITRPEEFGNHHAEYRNLDARGRLSSR